MIATTARTTAPTIQGQRRGFPDGSSGGVFAAFSGARFSGRAAVLAAGGAGGPSVCVGLIYSSGPGQTPVLKCRVQVPDLSRRRGFFKACSLAACLRPTRGFQRALRTAFRHPRARSNARARERACPLFL